MMRGGWMPGGSWRRMVCDTAVTCAFAVSRRAFGCRNILTIDWPLTVVDSRCSMLSTVVVSTRSNWVVIRPSISSGFRPVNCQATEITGMSMFGKMSVGVRRMSTGLSNKMSTARTTNVYGRCSATLTIHMSYRCGGGRRGFTVPPSRLCTRSGNVAPLDGDGVPRRRLGLAEPAPQQRPRAMNCGIDVRGAEVQSLADLLVRKAVQIAQDEDRAVVHRELVDRLGQLGANHGLSGRVLDGQRPVAGQPGVARALGQQSGDRVRRDVALTASPPANLLIGGVGHDAIEPRPERGLAAKAVDLVHDRQQRVLHHFLGVLRRARDADGQAVGAGAVDLKETLGGARILAAQRLDELTVAIHAGSRAVTLDVGLGRRESSLEKHAQLLLSSSGLTGTAVPGRRDHGVSGGVKNDVATRATTSSRDEAQGTGHLRGGVVPHQSRGGRLPSVLLLYERRREELTVEEYDERARSREKFRSDERQRDGATLADQRTVRVGCRRSGGVDGRPRSTPLPVRGALPDRRRLRVPDGRLRGVGRGLDGCPAVPVVLPEPAGLPARAGPAAQPGGPARIPDGGARGDEPGVEAARVVPGDRGPARPAQARDRNYS